MEPRAGGGLFDLTGRVAVVTGSTRGIGLAIARRLAEHGARVVVSSRKPEACDAAAEDINRAHPGAAMPIPCHIGHKDQLQALVDRTISALGQVDVLVANAAVNPWAGPMADLPDAAFDKVLASNVRSNHWLARMVVPSMRAQGGGSIIFISSIGGLIGTDVLGAYAVSKAAEMQLARNLAVEHGRTTSGRTRSRPAWCGPTSPACSGRTRPRCAGPPSGRPCAGSPSRTRSRAAVFLASPAGAFVTGQTIVVDGGSTIAPTI